MIWDLTEVFSGPRLEALGFKNFVDAELVETEWGGSVEEMAGTLVYLLEQNGLHCSCAVGGAAGWNQNL